jgi:hypothetical protein
MPKPPSPFPASPGLPARGARERAVVALAGPGCRQGSGVTDGARHQMNVAFAQLLGNRGLKQAELGSEQ